MTESQLQTLPELLEPYARLCQGDLERHLLERDVPATLASAMRYCVLDGGKRLRPALVLMSWRALREDQFDPRVRRAAVALELLHTYSLVHDDLPAMDNDTLRRGRPTAHVQFGEAMAILAGDALLTRALGLLAEGRPDATSAAMIDELARAAGPAGMIAGQVADMDLCPVPEGAEGLHYIHSRKTAALIRCATRLGAIAAGADAPRLEALGRYGQCLGLAFQLVDDLLDATGQARTLGKTPGKDAAGGKRTAVSQVGLAAAAAMADDLTGRAVEALAILGPRAAELAHLAKLLTQRKS
jgi:farnesyl diphosphate synthase